MVALQLVAVLAVAVLMLLLNAIPRYGYLASSTALLVLFMFQAANLDARQGTFYSVMAVSVLLFAMMRLGAQEQNAATIAGTRFTGLQYSFLVIAVAVALFAFMRSLQASSTAQILGVPGTLAAGVSLSYLSPAFLGVLGYRGHAY